MWEPKFALVLLVHCCPQLLKGCQEWGWEMKLIKVLSVCALFLFFASYAWCDCVRGHWPIEGIYQTTNGTILSGRASEAWCTVASPGVPGNTENAMSWNGATLGTQWKVWGQAIDATGAVLVGSHVDQYGNGYNDYVTSYVGGQFWLSKNHLWGDGTTDYTGTLTSYNVSARVTLFGGQIVGVTSNVHFTGVFDGCPNCKLDYVITNAMLAWMPGWGIQPGNYPPLLCGATLGELYDVCCIRAQISCTPVPVEESTWGTIKVLYR